MHLSFSKYIDFPITAFNIKKKLQILKRFYFFFCQICAHTVQIQVVYFFLNYKENYHELEI